MEVQLHQSITAIPSHIWDSIITPKDWLHSHSFLSTLQQSKVENATLYFITIYHQQQLIATAVISIFQINIDLFINADSIAKCIKKIRPNFFKIPIVCCGTPLSAGQKNIYCINGFETAVANIVYQQMKQIAKARKIKTILIKEFSSKEIQQWNTFQQLKFVTAHSLPHTVLKIKWTNYQDYLYSLKANYRRQIKQSINKICNPSADQNWIENPIDAMGKIHTLSTSDISASTFYNLYVKVMQRSTTKLETLPLAFFQNLWLQHPETLKVLTLATTKTQNIAFIFTHIQDEVVFLWVGKNYIKDDNNSYNNLLNMLTSYAIQHNCSALQLGQTSYYPKMKIGGILEPRYFFIQSNSKWIQMLFQKYNAQIFPKTETQQLSVFHNT